ncbi:Diaminopimelate epimerase-like protein [Cutaneotrichosporon oleaginosum]|uniref:Diaminopimelate epimerase-like protein n=1 Tax=Cutaneotrichosporon oleaginosum TaxID=879819 RepID=A0A0J0XIN0_9TREE|nr:Diaminopimelate epimerase-like protein [Cutaneotrichosporon oleaginosum]KLT40907.1 Diaminopimelate epimerase-like protein [Cutaneotrichosporon oleaginosum]TXT15400.1 hypothetical protein COLE_01593 [Cutaneotrichosporon oleaginosum]
MARFFLANAFATHAHGGNQAAVVLLPPGDERGLDDAYCRALGEDFKMPMTAVVTPRGEGVYALRWWTASGQESRLCGHATLATSHILFNCVETSAKEVYFDTLAGRLTATCVSRGQGGEVAISLPIGGPSAPSARSGEFGKLFASAAGLDPRKIEEVVTYMDDRSCIVRLTPDVDLASLKVDSRSLYPTIAHYCIVTQLDRTRAGGINSRVFIEGFGIPEDPVTGSAHATLAEYYLLGHGRGFLNGADPKSVTLDARQVSKRGGGLKVSLEDGRVKVVGKTWIWGEGEMVEV